VSYTFTQLDDGHIILFTAGDDFNLKAEGEQYIRELRAFVETGPERMVAISDVRNISMDFEDVLAGGGMARNDDTKAFLKHPNLLKSLVVFNSRVIEMTVKGLSSATFGSLDIPLYTTMEEALNAARSMIYGEAKAN
jgi:hypothetical protein